MRAFILRRLGEALITLVLLSIIVFGLARMTGDPTDLLLPMDAPPQARDRLRQDLGLDQPYHIQYWTFISQAVRGDFGRSIALMRPAMDVVLERLPNSIKLAGLAMALALLGCFPLGVLAAVRRGTWVDQGASLIAVLGVTMPVFLLGILLIQLMSVNLRLLPTGGMERGFLSFILPALTLAVAVLASLTRLLRSSMIEVLDADFMKLARLKGLKESVVIWKHAVRNSLIPMLTMAGMYFARLVSFAVVVEAVFAWPGVGTLAYEAIRGRDFPVIQSVIIVVAGLVMLVNLLVDIAYVYVDPRIRYR